LIFNVLSSQNYFLSIILYFCLYFLYNSEGPLNKDKFVNIISKKEPEDSSRKDKYIYKNHQKDGNTNNTRENNFNKIY